LYIRCKSTAVDAGDRLKDLYERLINVKD
jgi:hypothetical protein